MLIQIGAGVKKRFTGERILQIIPKAQILLPDNPTPLPDPQPGRISDHPIDGVKRIPQIHRAGHGSRKGTAVSFRRGVIQKAAVDKLPVQLPLIVGRHGKRKGLAPPIGLPASLRFTATEDAHLGLPGAVDHHIGQGAEKPSFFQPLKPLDGFPLQINAGHPGAATNLRSGFPCFFFQNLQAAIRVEPDALCKALLHLPADRFIQFFVKTAGSAEIVGEHIP